MFERSSMNTSTATYVAAPSSLTAPFDRYVLCSSVVNRTVRCSAASTKEKNLSEYLP